MAIYYDDTHTISDGTAAGQVAIWDGSDWTPLDTSKFFYNSANGRFGIGTTDPTLGKLQVVGGIYSDNFRTDETTNHTVFIGDDAGGSGTYSAFVGEHAGQNNTGTHSNAVGSYALHNNTGTNSNAIGYFALQNNTGAYSNAIGRFTLQNNTGAYPNAIGNQALRNNTGAQSNAFGYTALYNNTGTNSNALGYAALQHNDGNNNTAIGHESFNTWTADTGSAKVVESVDFANNQVTITAHGWTTAVNLKATTTGTLPTGLNADVHHWRVINADILKCKSIDFTDAGSGTLTLTPRVTYTNSSAFGYNAEPDASNQVMLGDANVTEIKTSGSAYFGGSGDNYFGGNIGIGGLVARNIGMERGTVADTAGFNLTTNAGGATSAATDKAGGDLILNPGVSTGSAESGVQIRGCVAGGAGTGDNSFSTMFQALGNKIGFHGVTPITRAVLATGAGATVDNVISALQNLGLVSQS